jgi:hypothetical protein
MGRLQAYVCRRCGYTELYTKEAAQLPLAKLPGAKLLTPEDPVLVSVRPPLPKR